MLDIIYRICEKREGTWIGDHRPKWFTKEKCLSSFFNAVNNSKEFVNSITFIHDGPVGPLYDILQKKYVKIVKTNHGSYYGALKEAYGIAKDLEHDLYFVEDDYLHLPDSIKKIALAIPKFKLLSPYDHLARYDPVRYDYGNQDRPYELKITFDEVSNHHWRTNESACQTFAIDQNSFKNGGYDILMMHDCLSHDKHLYKIMCDAGWPLWTPVTALATQVDPYLSPGIDWEKFNETVE